jgi:hypothetical protein
MFIPILYMFRVAMYPSSGELILSIRHLVYVTLYRWPFGMPVWMCLSFIQTCTLNGHPYKVTYTRCRIDTINSPDDWRHTWKRILRQVGYSQRLYRDARSTEHKISRNISVHTQCIIILEPIVIYLVFVLQYPLSRTPVLFGFSHAFSLISFFYSPVSCSL